MTSCPVIGVLSTMYASAAGDWCKPFVAESYGMAFWSFALKTHWLILHHHSCGISDYFPGMERPLQTTPLLLASFLLTVHPLDEQTSEENNTILYFLRPFQVWGLCKYCPTVHVLGQTLRGPDIWHRKSTMTPMIDHTRVLFPSLRPR